MLDKLKNIFYNELKTDTLTKLENDFYCKVREYFKNTEGIEKERILYFYGELRKLRLYKFFLFDNNIDKLTDEEKELVDKITNIKEDINIEDEISQNKEIIELPKPIYTINNIEIVKVEKNFPSFTIDGENIISLKKEDVLSMDEKIIKILEKHNIVKRFNIKKEGNL